MKFFHEIDGLSIKRAELNVTHRMRVRAILTYTVYYACTYFRHSYNLFHVAKTDCNEIRNQKGDRMKRNGLLDRIVMISSGIVDNILA